LPGTSPPARRRSGNAVWPAPLIAIASTMRLTGMPARSLSSRTAAADGPSYTEKTTSSAGIRMQLTSRMRVPSLVISAITCRARSAASRSSSLVTPGQ